VATRSRRNTLLAAASAVGVVAGCLLLAARILSFADIVGIGYAPKWVTLVDVIDIAGAVALAAAFGVSRAGFLGNTRENRARTLAIAAGLFAAYAAAAFADHLIFLINTGDEPWKSTASQWASVAEGLALLVAALLIRIGLRSSRPGRLLGWGCLVLAGHYLLSASAFGFGLAGYYDFFSPSARVVATFIASAVGYLVAAIAAVKAAIAFRAGGSRRDRELGVAAILFAVGFLITTGGAIISASSAGRVSLWLTSFYVLALAVAAGVGAAAFFSLEQRDGPDIPVMPNPA
jgi:hypothetical protein